MFELILGAVGLSILSEALGDTTRSRYSGSSYPPPKPIEPPKPPLLIGPESEYSDWHAKWKDNINKDRWIPKGRAQEIIQQFPPFKNGSETNDPISQHPQFEKALNKEFDAANAVFNTKQKKRLNDFFSSVEENPLTDEQKDCCICMDSAVQIVAAAGSGKTSTIIARIGYALKEGLVSPKEILIIAFNKSVKKEIENRIKECLDDIPDIKQITIKTFNALGLEIVKESTGQKARLAHWVEQNTEIQTIINIIEDLRQRDPVFRRDWDLFKIVYGRGVDNWKTLEQSKNNIRTADGKWVKSKEERMICNYLFSYGVQYRYEREYEHDTRTTKYRKQYRPDFFYPNSNLYHEHFALNEAEEAPPHFSGKYVLGVQWKRDQHERKGTQFFETTSHGLRNGNDLERLKSELKKHGEIVKYDEKKTHSNQELISTEQLAGTMQKFLQRVKSNGLRFYDLDKNISNYEYDDRNRIKCFVKFYKRIAKEWQQLLDVDELVDYDDMILDAIKYLEEKTWQSPYKMILVDEFQDVSQAKLRLLKALKNSAGPSVNLCVVGDDWQGINRFAGADISVMTGFKQTFSNATQLILNTTFRCPQKLCDASSNFIQKNPKQIKKTIETTNTYERAGLYTFAAKTKSGILDRIGKELKRMYESAKNGQLDVPNGNTISVQMLGRYNNDEPNDLEKWQCTYGSQLEINFSTIHAAKGMEADYIMLLNIIEDFKGFPSQINDDPVLQIAMPNPDNFPLAEERRLFYVALTRARRQTHIYTLQDKLSRFIVELVEDGYTKIKTGKGTLDICPKCRTSILEEKNGRNGPFIGCNAYPGCGYTKNIDYPKRS